MAIDTIEKMEALMLECEKQLENDKHPLWADCYNALFDCVEYQKAKQCSVLRKLGAID